MLSFHTRNCRCLVSLLFLTCLLGCSESKQTAQIPEMPVHSALARKADMPEILTALGRVEASASVTIKAQVSGQLLAKYFEEGQFVKKGEKLFSIDPRPFEAALAASRAELERNTILMEKAHEDMKRYQSLIGKSVVSKEQYDQIKSVFESLKANVKANEASVESAKVQLDYCTIYAPINGKIGRLAVDVGNVIKAEDVPLVSIEQMQPIRVAFTLPELELGRVLEKISQETLRVDAFPDATDKKMERGTLLFLDNAVDQTTGTILLVAEFPNTDLLLFPGQFVRVALYIDSIKDAIIVPQSAVQTGIQGLFVFVISDDNHVIMRPVATGIRSFDEIVVTDGLKSGERVVTAGHLRLTDGTKVIEQPDHRDNAMQKNDATQH